MSQAAENLWSEAERDAWRLPEKMTVSEWAEKNRVLDAKNANESGPWKNSRTPYLVGVMDVFTDPGIEEITVMSSAQVGKTESIFNMIGYVADQDPGSALFIKAREDDAFSDAHNRLRPMFAESPSLRRRIPSGKAEDLLTKEFRLDRMNLFFAGSNSPAALASKSIRYLFMDETDKWPLFSGREASPIKLALERTKTYWNRKIVKLSTPTTEHGYIWKEYQRSDQRRFFVPCPHCGHFQVLSFQNIVIPKDEREPGRIRELKLAWYECEHCREKITDGHKAKMLRKGVWVAKGQKITAEGIVKGERPHGNHAGFWFNCLYSPWLTFSQIMAEFLESKDHDELLMNFVNSWLAEIWREKAEYRDATQVMHNRAEYPGGQVPGGAVLLTAGIDVQKHVLYYVVRGWGARMRSWLVEEGQIEGEDLAEVEKAILSRTWPVLGADIEGGPASPDGLRRGGGALPLALACMDSGYRTDEVYDFCRGRRNCRAIKGASRRPLRPIAMNVVDVHPVTGARMTAGGVRLWTIDTEHFKDFIFRRMNYPPDSEDGWHIHQDVSLDYADQITSEQRVEVKRGRDTWLEWQVKQAGRRNHLWDAEVYAAAAAHMLQFEIERLARAADAPPRPAPPAPRQRDGWLPRGEGWLKR